jgi:glycosyltransferase involved in cell wall biosynthesis
MTPPDSTASAPRVLHLIETGGPGGAESVFATLVAGARGSRALGVVPYDGWLAATLRERHCEPVVVPNTGAFDVAYLRRVLELIRRERIDVLCAHLFGAAVYGAVLSVISRVPLVSVLHGVSDYASNARFAALKTWLVRNRSDALVFVSESLRSTLAPAMGVPATKTRIIYNGSDTSRLRPNRDADLRHRLALPDDSVVIGSLGNIRAAKGYDVLLDAARTLCARDARVHFVIAGQPQEPLQAALVERRREYELEQRVHFIGMQRDAAEFLNGIDIFLLPSKSEGFSIACVEAMACELPIVATRCGGPEEILEHEVTGLLVAHSQPLEIVAALTSMIVDASLRERLARNARRHAIATFGLDRMLNAYEALFATLARRGGARP